MPMAAMPMEAPSWLTVLNSPEPVPTSGAVTSVRVSYAMGATTSPMPAAPMRMPGSRASVPVCASAPAAVSSPVPIGDRANGRGLSADRSR